MVRGRDYDRILVVFRDADRLDGSRVIRLDGSGDVLEVVGNCVLVRFQLLVDLLVVRLVRCLLRRNLPYLVRSCFGMGPCVLVVGFGFHGRFLVRLRLLLLLRRLLSGIRNKK